MFIAPFSVLERVESVHFQKMARPVARIRNLRALLTIAIPAPHVIVLALQAVRDKFKLVALRILNVQPLVDTPAYAAGGLLLVPAGTLNPGDRSVRAPIGSAHDLVFLWTPTSWQPSFHWGDRRDSNPHDWSHNPVPEPFGHGHTCWSTRADSNRVLSGTSRGHLRLCFECYESFVTVGVNEHKYSAHSSMAMPTDRSKPRAVCTLAGITRCSSFMPASSGVLASLAWFHFLQAVTRFSHVFRPPRERGSTWSSVSSLPWNLRLQYWQVWLSRR